MKKEKRLNNNNNSGFTLIELLLTLALISILTGSMLTIARFSETNKNLTLAKDQVRGAIRTAQSYSLSIPNATGGNHVCGFGFRSVDDETYDVYYTTATSTAWNSNPQTACDNCAYNGSPSSVPGGCGVTSVTNNVGTKMPQDVSITTDNYVFFEAPYGEVSPAAGATFTLKNSADNSYDLEVNGFGEIE